MNSRLMTVLACILCLANGKIALAANEITCDKNPIAPGETVKLRWFFTGDKVTVVGGGFGKGAVVTGKSGITDKPTTTTRYTFTTNYISESKDPKTGGIIRKPIKSVYSIVIEVEPEKAWLNMFKSGRYQVAYRRGWKADAVNLQGEGNDALVYFQKEDDSVERMSVAVMAANDMTNEDLIKKVRASIPGSYSEIINIGEEPMTIGGTPAIKFTFAGKASTHPNILTHTILAVFVKDSRAYVVSMRTFSAQYEARKRLMEKMLSSFVCKS